ncbi:carboxypeptidase-like regulatory domain-containing protein [bacterium]|nr:carboxypeptidase-like regulatory domain-containing protein [bacterium]
MRAVSLVVCLVCLVCSVAAAVPVTGKVSDAAGKPLAGVRVYVLVIADRDAESFRAPWKQVVTGADGAFALDWPLAPEKVSYSMAMVYQPGLAVDFVSGGRLVPLSFVLKPTVPIKGSVLGDDGKPLAGARVTLDSCYEQSEGSYKHGQVPPELRDVLAVRTDANGQYALEVVATGVRPTLAISAPGYGEARITFEKQVTPVRLTRAGSLRGQLVCTDPAVPLAGWTVSVYGTGPPGGNTHSYYNSVCQTQAQGQFSLPELPPADYQFRVTAPSGVGYGAREGKATVTSGQTAEMKLTVEKLLPVKGRVVGADTKKGLANIGVSVGSSGAQTGPDGTFRVQCLPGTVTAYAYDRDSNYRSSDYRSPKQYTLAAPGLDVGDIVLQPAFRVSVQVVDEAGQPVAGAKLNYQQSGDDALPPFARSDLATDATGSYTLKGLTGDTLVVSATKDDLASEPAQVDVAKQQGPVKLVLRPGLMCAMTVTLRDQDGRPITDAAVQVYEQTNQYGRNRAAPPADATGCITAVRLTPGNGYNFEIEAPGCWPMGTPKWTAVAGQTHDCGVITLTRNRGLVAGKVVDAAGKPAAGMIVVCSMEAPQPASATTGADGSFRLAGLMEGPVCLFVHSGGLRCTAQIAKTGQEDVVLQAPAARPLRYNAGEAARATGGGGEAAGAGEPSPQAAQQAQDLILEALEKTKGGDTWDRWRLLLALAKRDPQLALQTAAAHGDKDDGVRAVVAMQHLCDAPQDAKLMLQALDPEQVQQSIMYAHGWHLGRVAPEMGARIGEALLESARRQRGSESVSGWALALRWLQRYDPAQAEALIPGLLLRAQTLGVSERDAYARTMAAQIIVGQDPAAALELLKPIADDNDLQRYTAKLAPCLAGRDPKRAVALLKGLKQDWYREQEMPECLAAFPAAQRDLALAEARQLKSAYAKARALAKLAQLLPREQAPGLLTEAAEALLQGGDMRGYPMQENVTGLLCLGLVAQRLGCEEYREIVWRGVAAHAPNADYGPRPVSESARTQVQLASRLGTCDPVLGRHILELALKRVGDWRQEEAYTQRSIVSAAAAIDPQWGLELVRQMPLDPDVKKRDGWTAGMLAVAGRLWQSEAERTTALLQSDGMGRSWLAEDDSLD